MFCECSTSGARWSLEVANADDQSVDLVATGAEYARLPITLFAQASLEYHEVQLYDYMDSNDDSRFATWTEPLDPTCILFETPTPRPSSQPTTSLASKSEDICTINVALNARPACPPTRRLAAFDPRFTRIASSAAFSFPSSLRVFITTTADADGLTQYCIYDGGSIVVSGRYASRSFVRRDDGIAKITEAWCEACGIDACDLSNPSDDASEWTGPPFGRGLGDPHFETLDGVEYTFNGRGDYLFLTFNGTQFEIDARLVSWPSVSDVSVISALSFKSGAQELVLLANNNGFDVYIGGDFYQTSDELDFPFSVGSTISVVNGSLGYLWVIYENIVSVGAKNVNDTISYAVANYLNSTDFDGALTYSGDAFNATEISRAFQGWLKSNTSSLYDALGPTEINTTSWRALSPSITIPVYCEGSLQCAFDADATGSTDFAVGTLTEAAAISSIVETLQESVTTCTMPQATVSISHVADGVFEGATLVSTCTFFTPFTETRMCINGSFVPPSELDCPNSALPNCPAACYSRRYSRRQLIFGSYHIDCSGCPFER